MTTSPFYRSVGGGVLAACLLALGAPAQADVKSGVDAWSAGDYATAVCEWSGPAQAGDADAQFNLGQAYRLGRGVEADKEQAEALYAAAAAQGHVQASDNYGLLLFEDGRREAAMPYITEMEPQHIGVKILHQREVIDIEYDMADRARLCPHENSFLAHRSV